MRLAQRLLVGALLVVALVVAVVVALSGHRLRSQLRALAVDQLSRDARLVALQWVPGADADSVADAAGEALRYRVTLIDDAGRVVGDSEFDGPALARLENHAARPEVVAARGSDAGWSRRVSPSAGGEELYVAVRAPLGTARVSVPTRQFDAIVSRARRDVLVSGLAGVLAAALLAWLFSRAVSRPVVELSDVAQALAAGDLSRRPSLTAPGEVGDLAAAVHAMAQQLDARLRALQDDDALLGSTIESLHEGVIVVDARRCVVRVNESGRRLLALRDPVPFPADRLPRDPVLREALGDALAGHATDQAEVLIRAASPVTLALRARPLAGGGAVLALYDLTAVRRLETVRRDFVANVSHELKTPLTAISGFAETLATDEPDAEHRRQFAEVIQSNARRMQRIVDDLLDLSRIESGGWVPNPVAVDARAAAADAVAPCREAADAKGIALRTAIDPGAASVVADPTALRQVIANLIDNALRYTPRGGSVEVFTEPDGAGVWVGVRDTGIGIAAEHLPRIFERFYRVDAARSREAGGTGLGLAIVRHLAEAHGGRARAASVPGRGTTVAVFLPGRAADEA